MKKYDISMLFTLAPAESAHVEETRPSKAKPHQDKRRGNRARGQFMRGIKEDTREALEDIQLERNAFKR